MTTVEASASIPSAARIGRVGLFIFAVAVLLNLLVLVVAVMFGTDMTVVSGAGGQPQEIDAVMVVISTFVPVLVGAVALVVARSRGDRGWQVLRWLGLGIAVLTIGMPFGVEATTATSVTLAAMHLVVGAVWFVVLTRTGSVHQRRAVA